MGRQEGKVRKVKGRNEREARTPKVLLNVIKKEIFFFFNVHFHGYGYGYGHGK